MEKIVDCIFCKIISGQILCHIIHQSKSTISFLDIYPHAEGHTVIIPKIHAEKLEDVPEPILSHILTDIKSTMNLLTRTLQPQGFNIGWNNGTTAGQVIPHLHIHLFPRYENDGGESFHSIIKNPGKRTVDEIAKLFRKK